MSQYQDGVRPSTRSLTGPRVTQESSVSINVLELRAIRLEPHRLPLVLLGKTVMVFSANDFALSYLAK